jgi:electron transport complex protein RnfA
MLIQEAIDNVGNPDMPEAFVGLPSLLIYIGILAMAFTGFNGGPSVFL